MKTNTVKKRLKPKATRKSKTTSPSHCEIVVVLDRSGSMSSIRKDMEGGFDAFIAEQQKDAGTCNVTLVQFDSPGGPETVYEAKPIETVPPLQFVPRGMTPLLDAVGGAVADTQKRVKGKKTKVVIVVITDGYENASVEWTNETVKALVKERTKAGWLFVFLGADVNSFAEASKIGIPSANSMDYAKTRDGVTNMFHSTAKTLSSYRNSTGSVEEALGAAAFTDEDRAKAIE